MSAHGVCVCVCVCVYVRTYVRTYTSGLALLLLLSILVLSGDTLYCKLEKKKKHADESLYTALGTPCKQAVFTNQAFNENADPDHVYSNVAEENGGYDSSSVHANLESGLSCLSV